MRGLSLGFIDDAILRRDLALLEVLEKQFCSWMGVTPRVWQSGEKTWIGGMGGPGNRRMRWLLVQCAHVARRIDPRMRRHYERIEGRRGVKCGVAAVAHEMASVMYYI